MPECGQMSKTHGLTFIVIRIHVDFVALISLKISKIVIAESLGLKMKIAMKANAVPTIFKIGPPQTKNSTRDGDNDTGNEINYCFKVLTTTAIEKTPQLTMVLNR